jgi:hypothetical protein
MCIIAVVATMNGYMNWMLLQMSSAAKVDSYEDLCERVCEFSCERNPMLLST